MRFLLALVALTVLPIVAAADERAATDTHMDVARHYQVKNEHLAALNRLKIVLSQFQASAHAGEALARIAESYLALGAASEAQTAVAVLDRKFPDSPWSIHAHAVLESATLAPLENEQSWISKAFR